MTKAARSIYFFSLYLLLAGLALFLFPNPIIRILGLASTSEAWIHIVGLLTFILGVFFMYMAKREIRPFFYISIFCRGIFVLGIITLILFYHAPTPLLLFALVDVIGLLWTLVAYRSGAAK